MQQVSSLLDTFSSPEQKKKLQDFSLLEKQLSQLVDKLNVVSSRIEHQHQEMDQKKLDLAHAEATKIRISESLAGNSAVQEVLKAKINGIFGTVASLGTVDPKYSTALEVAAGARINSIIVSTDAIAAQCIQLLKDKKIGTAMFLPLNKLKSRNPVGELEQLKNFSGVKDISLKLITYDKKYEAGEKSIFNWFENPRRISGLSGGGGNVCFEHGLRRFFA